MKKLVIVLIALSFLASCGNKEEEVITETGSTQTGEIDIDSNEKDENMEVENTGSTQVIDTNNDKKINNNDSKNNSNINNGTNNNNSTDMNKGEKTETKVGVNTDDAVLEEEVNDLLDEFIESLDKYDK